MKKLHLIISLLMFSIVVTAQPVVTNAYGDTFKIHNRDTTKPAELVLKNASRTCTGCVLTNTGNGKTAFIAASTGDTTSLSNRINLKVNISDTASMLSHYLRANVAAATYATIVNLALKLSLSDTASMLSNYLRANTAAATYATIANLALKVNISDTASMLSPYLRANTATATYATIANLALKVNISDTASMLSPYVRANTAAATYQTKLTNPVTGTGTTNYFPRFSGTSTIMNSAMRQDTGGIVVATTSYATANGQTLYAMDFIPSYNANSYSAITNGGYRVGGRILLNSYLEQNSSSSPSYFYGYNLLTTASGASNGSIVLGNNGSGNEQGFASGYGGGNRLNAFLKTNLGTTSYFSVNIGGTDRVTMNGNAEVLINTTTSTGSKLAVNGNIEMVTAGNKIKIATGTNSSASNSATLVNGVVTINTTAVTTNSIIQLIPKSANASTALGRYTYSIVNATSFTVTSVQVANPSTTETGDQSTFTYVIIN